MKLVKDFTMDDIEKEMEAVYEWIWGLEQQRLEEEEIEAYYDYIRRENETEIEQNRISTIERWEC